jgi:hypothetical protein
MIQDPRELEDIRESWSFALTASISVSVAFNNTLPMLNATQRRAVDLANNATLLFAFSVHEKTLLQLRREGHFECRERQVGALMDASKNVLPWRDFAEISAARERRNAIAHHNQILPSVQCWDDIATIRDELIAWGVVDVP